MIIKYPSYLICSTYVRDVAFSSFSRDSVKMNHDMTKPTKWVCAQQKLRSAWASAQSDQSLQCTEWVAKDPRFLHGDSEDSDRTGRMPGWFESLLGAQSFCWFCHVAAQIKFSNFVHVLSHISEQSPFPIINTICLYLVQLIVIIIRTKFSFIAMRWVVGQLWSCPDRE